MPVTETGLQKIAGYVGDGVVAVEEEEEELVVVEMEGERLEDHTDGEGAIVGRIEVNPVEEGEREDNCEGEEIGAEEGWAGAALD